MFGLIIVSVWECIVVIVVGQQVVQGLTTGVVKREMRSV
jgi:hypothetical protein